jgi:hypothetical protein
VCNAACAAVGLRATACQLTVGLLLQAVEVMQKRGLNEDACSRLVVQLLAYVQGEAPFHTECPLGMQVVDWFADRPDDSADVLKSPAALLYSFCPHAADSERLFSLLGFYKEQRRTGLGVSTIGMMATVKLHDDQQRPGYASVDQHRHLRHSIATCLETSEVRACALDTRIAADVAEVLHIIANDVVYCEASGNNRLSCMQAGASAGGSRAWR